MIFIIRCRYMVIVAVAENGDVTIVVLPLEAARP
jgi:hypothetical protein